MVPTPRKTSLDQKNRKNKSLTHQENYVIYAINIQDPSLKWIEFEFAKELAKHTRKAVVGISACDLLEEFKGSERFSQLSASYGYTDGSSEENLEEFYSMELFELFARKVQKLLSNNLHNDSYDSYNIIDIWDNEKPTKMPLESKKSEKRKPKSLISIVASKASIGPKPFEMPNHICLLTPNDHHYVQPSKNQNFDRKKFLASKQQIVDHPENSNIDLYIILLGNLQANTYLSLLRSNYPLRGITYFHPKTSEIPQSKDFDELISDSLTKNITILEKQIEPLSHCLADRFAKTIYDEFSYYVYDMRLLESKHKDYWDNFNELNLDEHNVMPPLNGPIIDDPKLSICYPDEILVPIYFGLLLDRVCGENSNYKIRNQTYPTDLIHLNENSTNYTFIENSNEILKLTKSLNIDPIYYEMALQNLQRSIWFNELHEETSSDESFCLKSDLTCCLHTTIFSEYIEIFTRKSFIQKLNEFESDLIKLSSECDNQQNLANFMGWNDKLFTYEPKSISIPTKLCLRDYATYLYVDSIEATLQEENIDDNLIPSKKMEEIMLENEFIRENSLKAIRKARKSDTDGDESLESLSNIKSKYARAQVIITDLSDDSEVEKYDGYNLGSTYKQLTFSETIFKPDPNLALRFVNDSWLNGAQSIQLSFLIFGCKIYFNKTLYEARNNIRLITRNHSTISINSFCWNKNQNFTQVCITWPTGLLITIAYNWNIERFINLNQRYLIDSHEELERIFNTDGSIIIIYKSELVKLIHPNGSIYETRRSQEVYESSTYNTSVFEMELIKRYKNILDSNNYLFTRPDGTIWTVTNNIIDDVTHRKLLLTEIIDYSSGELVENREDGIKYLWCEKYFQTYFPDGTAFVTKITEKELYEAQNNEIWEALLVNPLIRAPQSHIIVATIITELIQISYEEDRFILLSADYLIQNKDYASVDLAANHSITVKSPDSSIEFDGKNVTLQTSEEMSLIYDKNQFTIKSNSDSEEFLIKLNQSELELPVMEFKKNNEDLCLIDPMGNWMMPKRSDYKSYHDKNNIENLLILRGNHEGIEIITKAELENIQESIEKNVIVEPLILLKDIFQMKLQWFDEFFEKFRRESYCDANEKNEINAKKIMSYRYIQKGQFDYTSGCFEILNYCVSIPELKSQFRSYIQSQEDKKRVKHRTPGDNKELYVAHYAELKMKREKILKLLKCKIFPKYFDINPRIKTVN